MNTLDRSGAGGSGFIPIVGMYKLTPHSGFCLVELVTFSLVVMRLEEKDCFTEVVGRARPRNSEERILTGR